MIEVIYRIRGKERRYAYKLGLLVLVAVAVCVADFAYYNWCFRNDACSTRMVDKAMKRVQK